MRSILITLSSTLVMGCAPTLPNGYDTTQFKNHFTDAETRALAQRCMGRIDGLLVKAKWARAGQTLVVVGGGITTAGGAYVAATDDDPSDKTLAAKIALATSLVTLLGSTIAPAEKVADDVRSRARKFDLAYAKQLSLRGTDETSPGAQAAKLEIISKLQECGSE